MFQLLECLSYDGLHLKPSGALRCYNVVCDDLCHHYNADDDDIDEANVAVDTEDYPLLKEDPTLVTIKDVSEATTIPSYASVLKKVKCLNMLTSYLSISLPPFFCLLPSTLSISLSRYFVFIYHWRSVLYENLVHVYLCSLYMHFCPILYILLHILNFLKTLNLNNELFMNY